MPRKFEVNKKLKVMKYTCKVFNTEANTFSEKSCYSKYAILQDPIKFCRKKLETAKEKVVAVSSIDAEVLQYGMTLEDFMRYGTETTGSASDEPIELTE